MLLLRVSLVCHFALVAWPVTVVKADGLCAAHSCDSSLSSPTGLGIGSTAQGNGFPAPFNTGTGSTSGTPLAAGKIMPTKTASRAGVYGGAGSLGPESVSSAWMNMIIFQY